MKCFRDLTYQSLIFQFPISLEYLGFFSSPENFATPKACNNKKILRELGRSVEKYVSDLLASDFDGIFQRNLRFIRWWYQLLFQSFYLVLDLDPEVGSKKHRNGEVKTRHKTSCFFWLIDGSIPWFMLKYKVTWICQVSMCLPSICPELLIPLVSKKSSPRRNNGLIKMNRESYSHWKMHHIWLGWIEGPSEKGWSSWNAASFVCEALMTRGTMHFRSFFRASIPKPCNAYWMLRRFMIWWMWLRSLKCFQICADTHPFQTDMA